VKDNMKTDVKPGYRGAGYVHLARSETN
jgi:hypothetical protein